MTNYLLLFTEIADVENNFKQHQNSAEDRGKCRKSNGAIQINVRKINFYIYETLKRKREVKHFVTATEGT